MTTTKSQQGKHHHKHHRGVDTASGVISTQPTTTTTTPPTTAANTKPKGDWHQGLCSWQQDAHLALHTLLCPCVIFGRVAEDVGESYDACCCCCLVPLLNVCCWMRVRGRIREDHALRGNRAGDLASLVFCCYCSLIQMHEEMRLGGATHGSKHFEQTLARI